MKSRLFVMTLRDHFTEKVEDIKLAAASGENRKRTDDWALRYVGVPWLQSIMEAFDDDGSGYITIHEVNTFTRALPTSLGWSLQHWIAYWAVGWRVTMTQYRDKIHVLLAQMFALRPRLLPENRNSAEHYLKAVWQSTVELTLAFKSEDLSSNDVPLSRFTPYAQYEEDRIRRNLSDIKFDIDALDTVYVVAGRGRIEKHLLILIFLLLQRDFDIFVLGRTQVLHPREFVNSAASLLFVFDATVFRVQDLSEFYRQHRLDVSTQFQTVACGLASVVNDPYLVDI